MVVDSRVEVGPGADLAVPVLEGGERRDDKEGPRHLVPPVGRVKEALCLTPNICGTEPPSQNQLTPQHITSFDEAPPYTHLISPDAALPGPRLVQNPQHRLPLSHC